MLLIYNLNFFKVNFIINMIYLSIYSLLKKVKKSEIFIIN